MKKLFLITVLTLLFFISCSKKQTQKETILNTTKIDTVSNESEVTTKSIKDTVIFTVQIAALKKKNAKLANLEGVQLYLEDGLIKYRLGNFYTYLEARNYRNQLRNSYKGAFVQVLKNNKPISIKEAIE
ncbi:MAG: SPOR domain-containing protein [Polaribacter sp.]|uniref:SPOR domain-containing protein n=1 Tax=Polaribacter sp. TaxID=1920175 RepID=UPI0026320360|nr:SPOR domain-containing protein [uncultured Polaribacter sp.]